MGITKVYMLLNFLFFSPVNLLYHSENHHLVAPKIAAIVWNSDGEVKSSGNSSVLIYFVSDGSFPPTLSQPVSLHFLAKIESHTQTWQEKQYHDDSWDQP